MVLEVAVIDVLTGSADDFEAAYKRGREIVLAAPGALGVRLVREIDSAVRFMLFVEWNDVAAHEAFRESNAYAAWREAVGSYFAVPPMAGHYRDV
jgi:quinol monooxygenase YgiN